MLHQKLQLTSITFLILFFGINVQSQTSDYLPDNLSLAPNGTFIHTSEDSPFEKTSDNGIYKAKYDIGRVTDEMRELVNFRLYKNEDLVYTLKKMPGSDVYISNSGFVSAMDMNLHFQQKLTIHLFNPQGKVQFQQSYSYASLFGFSPSGNYFVVGTDKALSVVSTLDDNIWQLDRSSQFAFSADENYLATAFEDKLLVYRNFEKINTFNTDLMYPRDVAILPTQNVVSVIGKQKLKIYSLSSNSLIKETGLEVHCAYRDLEVHENKILAGVLYKNKGTLKGILKVISPEGEIITTDVRTEKQYKTFEKPTKPLKSTSNYDPIPWPFYPFDQIHKVWNHYEQHMGDGSAYWAYLHQGLDIEVPDNEPTYAVAGGYVKLVLTLGGDAYWRVAVSPQQVSGYSDGWLYAHLVPGSIVVDVGDSVEIHEYLGDIINWSADWGHIHFANIRDQGEVWYYDDDEWGINFNPLLALQPLGDNVAPVIEDFSSSSKFGYCVNETSNYLSPDLLYGEVDIIAKISDYHADSEWEQPAYKTFYWITNPSANDTIVHKTLGQVLNHSYPWYSGGNYEPYATVMYKKDNSHPSPPWMNWDRDYWQILTNNNGDSLIDPGEAELSLVTPDFADGNYRIFVEAWDEAGNMAIDSQDVVFANYVGFEDYLIRESQKINCYPNPAKETITVDFNTASGTSELFVCDIKGKTVYTQEISQSRKHLKINSSQWDAGIYFISVRAAGQVTQSVKILVVE